MSFGLGVLVTLGCAVAAFVLGAVIVFAAKLDPEKLLMPVFSGLFLAFLGVAWAIH